MNEKKIIIIQYGEIALKKGNRGFFEGHLKKNNQRALKGLRYESLKNE